MHKYIEIILSGFRKIQTCQLPRHTEVTRVLSFKFLLRDLRVLRGKNSFSSTAHWKLLCPLLLFFCLFHTAVLHAQEINQEKNINWFKEAQVNINETGMVETTLLPGMHHILIASPATGSGLDLALFGPDNRQRPFELFWTEKGDIQKIRLEGSSLKLDNQKRLIWEGITPDNFIVKKILVGISDKNYIGKVDIEGLTSSGWRMLATDVALYRGAGDERAKIDISEGEYERLRLSFSGYDVRFKEIPAFIEEVEIEGEISKTGYKEEVIKPAIKSSHEKESAEIEMTLPGSGIFINRIVIRTGSIFKGQWQFGWDTISMGEQLFREIRRGEGNLTSIENPSLVIELGMPSNRETMIIKLKSEEYFGEILDVSIYARLPRLTFYADQKGIYTLKTGINKTARINETASGMEAGQRKEVLFADLRHNPESQPEQIPDNTVLRGGPFNDEGYTWRTGIHIDKPGFFRLALNDKAGLENNRQGIRIIKNNMQVPYFFGRKENRSIDIIEVFEYDKVENRSIMPLTLPTVSNHFTDIRFSGKGIFKREIIIETEKPGKIGWQQWLTREWISTQNEISHFDIRVDELPRYPSAMRLIINHGDNQPLLPEKIEAIYQCQDLFFMAGESGEYEVAGGNPKAKAASYDLSIVQDYLFNRVPEKIIMKDEKESFQNKKWTSKVASIFSEKGWGLYGVLGLVTLVLLVIIVRLFPRKQENKI